MRENNHRIIKRNSERMQKMTGRESDRIRTREKRQAATLPVDLLDNGEMTEVISSGNYPSKYGNRVDTRQTVLVPQGNTIKVHFLDLDIESQLFCSYDYLKIEDGNGSLLMDKTCGFELL